MTERLQKIAALSIGAILFTGIPLAAQSKQNKKTDQRRDDINAIGHRNVGKGLNLYSLAKEIAIGKQLAQELERSAKLIDDPFVLEYLNRLAENIRQNSDARVPIVIKVIDSSQPNAFSLPGGFLYLNSGLILQAESEAELAGVIAYLVAHVALRHTTKLATKGVILQLATTPLILLGPGGWAGYGTFQGVKLEIPLTFLHFLREAEREADYFGLQYTYEAGYDPETYVSFFGRLQDALLSAQTQKVPVAFSPYPPPSERVANMQEEIARILPERQQSIVSSSEFDEAKERLRAIVTPRRRKEGTDKPTLRTPEKEKKG